MGFPGTVNQLRAMLARREMVDEELMLQLGTDERVGVQKIYQQLQRKRRLMEEEETRLLKLLTWERRLGSPEILVAGVDEAGRGPLAGPVTAAAVILSPKILLPGLKDSKKIAPEERKHLSELIKSKSLAWSLGWASVEEIERYNILQASFLAMNRALGGLKIKPEHVLVDGWEIPGLEIPQTALVRGDNLSASIAAAAIIAKVARDQLMDKLHLQYPSYGFAKHKGYPTKEHYDALSIYGPSPVHRRTFKGVRVIQPTLDRKPSGG